VSGVEWSGVEWSGHCFNFVILTEQLFANKMPIVALAIFNTRATGCIPSHHQSVTIVLFIVVFVYTVFRNPIGLLYWIPPPLCSYLFRLLLRIEWVSFRK